jgi:alkylated DNA repair dioxygenase AlkB
MFSIFALVQQALFGRGTPRFDGMLRAPERFELGGGAWVERQAGWLDGHEQVFRELDRQGPGGVAWQSQRRMMYDREVEVPRLVARAPSTGAIGQLLGRLGAALSCRYQRSFENVSLAKYRSGQDSVAYHGDKMGRLVDDCIVATVSVGAPRRFCLKPSLDLQPISDLKPRSAATLVFDLGWGDLLVMGGNCQRTWQHAVPKRAHADPRISIMFRQPVPDGALSPQR